MLPPATSCARVRCAAAIVPIAGAIVLALLLRGVAIAQDVTEPALKAAFIYNFARFTTWPADLPSTDSFVICVLGDAAVGDALATRSRGAPAHGPPNRRHVRRHHGLQSAGAGSSTCPASQSARRRSVVGELRDAPVLTISNIEGFASAGGMTQFFFEHGQLRFRIHHESAKRAGLQISSRLLVMARPHD